MQKRHLEANTPEARAKMRKQLGTLRSLTVQPVTRQRYQDAKNKFFQYLEHEKLILPCTALAMDSVVSDYLEHLWANGAGRSAGSNILAALQDSQPHFKGKLQQSWRLLKTWSTHEVPNRAPPLPKDVLEAMIGYALFKNEPFFALSLMLAFHGLLRTGELLSVSRSHVTISHPKGPAVVSLGLTKSGKRQGAAESITVHEEDVCRRLFQWLNSPSSRKMLCHNSYSWRKFFNSTLEALGFSKWDYRPYSLRRGGATFAFQQHGALDRLLLLGRWQSVRTARIYLNDGLAVLAQISLVWSPFSRNMRQQYFTSLKASLPKLELYAQSAQARGTRKNQTPSRKNTAKNAGRKSSKARKKVSELNRNFLRSLDSACLGFGLAVE